jgi:hypothetical protein
MSDTDYPGEDYSDGDCWNCGGEGRVNYCIDGCCVDTDDIYCSYCSKRCDICNPAPVTKESEALRKVLGDALGRVGTPSK